MPQQGAPKLVEAPPPAAREPVAAPVSPPPQAQPRLPEVDIALAREKLRLKKQQELDRQKELEKQRLKNLQQEKLLLEKKRVLDKRLQDKRELDKKVAEDKKTDQDTKRKDALQAQQDVKKMEAQRTDNLKRIAGLAGATGALASTGTALKSSGPSAGYAGRIVAIIKPNIVFADDVAGNPTAELEVHAASDGTITSRKLLKSSGVKSWDDAVLRAIDKTEKLPRDVDGRVPQSLIISFRPKD